MAVSTFSFLATCVPGAEPWLEKELTRLGVTGSRVEGGVEARASLDAIRDILVKTRLAEAIRVRPIRAFEAASFEALQRGLNKVPWHAYMVAAHPLEVRVTCKQSRLYHSDAVAERVRAAIRRGPNQGLVLAQGDDINAHRNRVYVRVYKDQAQVSIDAAGEALHRRGYRVNIHEAPLRETLASLLLSIATEAAKQPITRLWDPFCGSGTIPLEWLSSTSGAQGGARRYIMDEWPCAKNVERTVTPADAVGAARVAAWLTDISDRAIAAARSNASLLGVEDRCAFVVSDFESASVDLTNPTAVVTNVPYGVRLNTPIEVNKLLERLDAFLLRHVTLRPAVVLWAGRGIPKGLRANWEHVLDMKNGGVPTSVMLLR